METFWGADVLGKRELSPDRAAGGAMPPQKTIKSTHGEDVKREAGF